VNEEKKRAGLFVTGLAVRTPIDSIMGKRTPERRRKENRRYGGGGKEVQKRSSK